MKFNPEKHTIFVIILFLIIFRLFHMDATVDDPHSWRQFDTKQYIEGYYYDNTPFLEPTVCWMGGHKTLILEFPLPEYMVAQLYKVFGPHLIVARLFFLLFFALAMLYFYKALRFIFDNYVPEITVLVAGMMPLAFYYSRAIHIDYFAISFAMAMLYFAMKAIRNQHLTSLLISVFCGIIAIMVKAPYAFYLAIPILVFAFTEKKLKWFLFRSPLYLIPVVLFLFWLKYTKSVNNQIPDWDYIPNFNKFTEMSYWYFGTMQQRMISQNWINILERIQHEILGVFGIFLLVFGVIFYKKSKAYWWALSFFLGTILYLVIFFNLNVIHNYYQLPFVLSLGILVAMGIQWLIDKLPSNRTSAFALMIVLIGVSVSESITYSEGNYFSENYYVKRVSEEIRKRTSRDDLVIVSFGGLTPQCPLILQPAGRYGWSIPIHDLTPGMIYELWKDTKVNKLAVVYGGYFEGEFQRFYEAMDNKESVAIDDKGLVLYMCDLDLTPPDSLKQQE